MFTLHSSFIILNTFEPLLITGDAYFADTLRKFIPSKSAGLSILPDAAFLSFSRQGPYADSVGARLFTGKFYKQLESKGCNPWMDAEGLKSGDSLTITIYKTCLLYTSPSPRDATLSRMPSSA